MNYKLRYWVFETIPYQFHGGVNDVIETTDSLDKAREYILNNKYNCIAVWDMDKREKLT